VEVSANIIADGRWQAFVRDITERKRRDDERRVFESLLDNSSDFIGIADPSGKPIYLNPAGRQMVGLPPDYPVEHTRIPDYYAPEQRKFSSAAAGLEKPTSGTGRPKRRFRCLMSTS
jgi:PAS domain-containing protein